MLMLVDPVKQEIDRFMSNRGLLPVKVDLIHQLGKAECLCSKPLLYPDLIISNRSKVHNADLDVQTCYIIEHQQSSADLQVSAIYSTLQLHYDRYSFHHHGWISHYDDITYSSSQWDQEPLDVYIVPFSHQDPGWKSPMEELFQDKTRQTINYILEFLGSDANMTFVWSEVIYLQKWYNQASKYSQNKLKELLSRGQLELLTGGWVMTDEAVAHHYAMLDQLIEGHQWLYNTLNYTVKTAWSLDTFGASPTMTYLLQGSGISNLLIQRIHYNLKRRLADQKQLEFFWRQVWDPKGRRDLFTHVPPFMLYNILYNCGPDPEICCHFDFTKKQCYHKGKYISPEPIDDGNFKEKSWMLLDQLRKKAQFFNHNKVLMLYGDDFRFHTRKEWQSLTNNLKQLMMYMNSQSSMHIKLRFSTVSDYFNAVRSTLTAHKQPIPSLSGDFFTYNDRDDQYWSGFFTSRPMFKYLTRVLWQKLRSADILFSLLCSYANNHYHQKLQHLTLSLWRDLREGRRALGLSQHHDAITGTSTTGTMTDYFKRTHEALFRVNSVAAAAVSFLLQHEASLNAALENELYVKLDIQQDSKKQVITKVLTEPLSILAVFNPLPSEREEFITVTVTTPFVQVEDKNHNPVQCQVAPLWTSWLQMSKSEYKLIFLVKLNPLAITRIVIKQVEASKTDICPLVHMEYISPIHNHHISSIFHISAVGLDDFVLSTPVISAYFCGCTGLLQGVLDKSTQLYRESKISFVRYGTGSWTNPFLDKSGAYIFLPNGPAQIVDQIQPKIMITFGPLLNEVQTVLPMVTQTVTMYDTSGSKGGAVHIENVVNLDGCNNTELAMRISTDINNNGVFYTDNNGFQMQRRTYLPKYKIQGNYYPITTQIFIEDKLFRATLHTSYSHGATSLSSGDMEVMLDRRLNQDDWRGLGEGIKDNVVTPSYFVLLLESKHKEDIRQPSYPSILSHQISHHLNTPAELFLQQMTSDLATDQYKPLATSWPSDIQLINLRSVDIKKDGIWYSLLVVQRLAYSCQYTNTYEECHTSNGSLPFSKMFSSPRIQNAEKTSLTGFSFSGTKEVVTSIELDIMEIKTYKIILS